MRKARGLARMCRKMRLETGSAPYRADMGCDVARAEYAADMSHGKWAWEGGDIGGAVGGQGATGGVVVLGRSHGGSRTLTDWYNTRNMMSMGQTKFLISMSYIQTNRPIQEF